jgi:hypothetical protein
VTLPVDATQALRTLPELRTLITSIRDASPTEPETDAIEWKRSLDLTSAEDRFNLARHVLGMGNRIPAVAERSFQGCGYVLVGVEPQRLAGCPVWDPADIDNWLARYIAPGSPRWHPTYVEVGGLEVLAITVEAPRHGDGLCTLQRDYDSAKAGRVFVRRSGTTTEASPAEIRALEGRLLGARPTLALDVAIAGEPEIARVRIDLQVAEQWIQQEATRYHDALERHQAARRRQFVPPVFGDPRRETDYVDEVNVYLEESGNRFRALTYQQVIQQRGGKLILEAQNPTPGNFEKVLLTVMLPDGVQAFFDEDEPFDALEAPDAPAEMGDQSPITPVTALRATAFVESDAVFREEGQALQLRYGSFHLRPGATERLAPVYLSVDDTWDEETVMLSWRATSTSVESWVEGEVTIPVSPAAVVPAVSPPSDTPTDAAK